MFPYNSTGRILWSKCLIGKRYYTTLQKMITTSDIVTEAIQKQKPMVALESTVLTHGMPWPINLQTGKELEDIIRQELSVPVTIGVLRNTIRAGFNCEELEEMSRSVMLTNKPKKVSRRDLYNIGSMEFGGTTVASTMIIAKKLGISVFVTGGIGGVHRDSLNSMDVSADLRELGRTSICVISSGVKSFLDIAKTLEYLETEGVLVCTLGSDYFPGFFVTSSGLKTPHRVDSIEEVVHMINHMEEFDISSGMLLAVPIPASFEEDGILIQEAIETSVRLSKDRNITGSEVTPFVLKNVSELTNGKSLEMNVRLIKNNAIIGGKVATCFNKMKKITSQKLSLATNNVHPLFVVIGGSMIDNNMKLTDKGLTGLKNFIAEASYNCESHQSGGGVARNIADVCSQLGQQCCFLSAIGEDYFGDILRRDSPQIDWSTVKLVNNVETSSVTVLILSNNEIVLNIGNFEMAKHVTPSYVAEHLVANKGRVSLICVDGNLPVETIRYVTKFAKDNKITTFYEPTDILLVPKIADLLSITAESRHPFDIISPNIKEFRYLYEILRNDRQKFNFQTNELEPKRRGDVEFVKHVIQNSNILDLIPTWIIKLGRNGVIFASREEIFFIHQSMFFIKKRDIVTASGAGDCLAACALFLHFREGLSWQESIAGGVRMAKESVESHRTVPSHIIINKYSKAAIESWTKEMYASKLLSKYNIVHYIGYYCSYARL